MDDSPEAMARMHKVFKYAYLTKEIPTDKTTGIIGPTLVTTYDMILVTNDKVPDAEVEKMLTVFSQNKKMLVGMHPAFRGFAVDAMYKDLPVPYHPAALEWFKAHGIDKAS